MENEVNAYDRPITSLEMQRIDPSSVLNIWHILQNVFSFLPGRDLCSCAQVSTVWNREANLMKKKRKLITLIQKEDASDSRRLNKFRDRKLKREIRGQWAVPKLALIFSTLASFRWEIEFELVSLFCHIETFGRSVFSHFFYENLPNRCDELMQEIKTKNKELRKYYPRSCGFFHVPLSIIEGKDWFERDRALCSQEITTLNFPANPDLQVNPFFIKNQTIEDKIGLQINVEDLYFSQWEINIEERIKCVILFVGVNDEIEIVDTERLKDTKVGHHIGEDTVVVGLRCQHLLMTSGISFSGESVRTEWMLISGRECCVRHRFILLKNSLDLEETGLCFVIPDVEDIEDHSCVFGNVFDLFAKILPNMKTIFFSKCRDNVKCAGVTSILEQTCNNCSLPSIQRDNAGVKVLFIILKT